MTKRLLAICLLAAAPLFTVAQTAPPSVVAGEVLEVQNIEGYSYLRLKTAQGETWAAVPTAAVKKGAKVTIENPMVMNNFESKALKRKFDKVVFGNLASGQPAAQAAVVPKTGGPHTLAKGPETPDVNVPRATGPNARTVGEIMTRSAELKDKTVLVRGKIVKINSGIRGVNWIHLRDGSGSAADQTNDLIVTSVEEHKVGDILTMQGVVRTNKDFGAGYTYKVIVEEGKARR